MLAFLDASASEMDTLMRMQNAVDIAAARKRTSQIKLERYAATEFPLASPARHPRS